MKENDGDVGVIMSVKKALIDKGLLEVKVDSERMSDMIEP